LSHGVSAVETMGWIVRRNADRQPSIEQLSRNVAAAETAVSFRAS
jgi:hypothetical protein